MKRFSLKHVALLAVLVLAPLFALLFGFISPRSFWMRGYPEAVHDFFPLWIVRNVSSFCSNFNHLPQFNSCLLNGVARNGLTATVVV